MSHLDTLNDAQKEAVLQTEGPLLVLAGAGAGKTRVLVHRILEIVRRGTAPERILAITFTNKAAKEMRERAEKLLRESPEVTLPAFEVDRLPFISTFHSLGLRLIKENYRALGFSRFPAVYDRNDSLRTMKQAIKDAGVDGDLEPRAVLSVASRNKGDGVTAEGFASSATTPRDRAMGEAWVRYERTLMQDGALDFDDLLARAVKLLRDHEDIRAHYQARWQYLLIDEYQDTNKIQSEMASYLVGPAKNICAVGDMDQCLVAGTRVTMSDGSTKPIEQIKKGELVLSNYGSGDLRPARVQRVLVKRAPREVITLTTSGGRTLSCTPEHMHFAGYRIAVSPQMFFTYLMRKGDRWRVGVSQVYTRGQKQPVLGFVQRCKHEHADDVWIVAAHATQNAARICEYQLSLRYAIPTLPFVARRGGSENGYVHDQKAIDAVFASFDTNQSALRLLADYGLSCVHPHHHAQSKNSIRRNITVTLCGDRRGATPMHRIAMVGNDAEGKRLLRKAGLSVRPAKPGSSSWRVETARTSWEELQTIVEQMRGVFPDAAVVHTARLGGLKKNMRDGNSLPFLPAGSLRVGMALFDEQGGFDVLERIEKTTTHGPRVYDLNIENTHNFIANGITTHNCIYGWRGADIRNIMAFEKQYPGGKAVLLEENYRSTKTIIAAANDLIAKNQFRVEKNLFTSNEDGERISFFKAFNETDEAEFVARTVRDLVDSGKAQPRDICVLYRANFQSRALEEAFLHSNISYQVLGTRFFERAEVKDALSWVRSALFATPPDLARASSAPKRGIGKTALLAMLAGKESELRGAGREAVGKFRALLARIATQTEVLMPSALLSLVMRESGMEAELRADKIEGAERMENVRELIALATRYDHLPKPDGIHAFIENAALASDQDEMKDEQNAVRLMTVHASKGLEFPIVFITGLEEGLFPYAREGGSAQDKEEERRLMYVAVTRARRKLYLCMASMRTVFGTQSFSEPSQFISDIPQDLIMEEEPERLGRTIYLS